MGSAFLVHSSVMEIMIVKMEVMKKTAVKIKPSVRRETSGALPALIPVELLPVR